MPLILKETSISAINIIGLEIPTSGRQFGYSHARVRSWTWVYRQRTPAKWSERDLNPWPPDFKSGALTTRQRSIHFDGKFVTWGQKWNDIEPLRGQKSNTRTLNKVNSFICSGSYLLKQNTRCCPTYFITSTEVPKTHERNGIETSCMEQRYILVWQLQNNDGHSLWIFLVLTTVKSLLKAISFFRASWGIRLSTFQHCGPL